MLRRECRLTLNEWQIIGCSFYLNEGVIIYCFPNPYATYSTKSRVHNPHYTVIPNISNTSRRGQVKADWLLNNFTQVEVKCTQTFLNKIKKKKKSTTKNTTWVLWVCDYETIHLIWLKNTYVFKPILWTPHIY